MDNATETNSARFALSEHLPEGKIVVPIEDADGNWIWAIRRGEMSEEAVAEVNRLLTHVTRHGLWIRPQDTRGNPPHPQRRAS